MNLFEIKVSLILKYEINYIRSLEAISKLISSALCKTSLKELHNKKDFKFYSFSNFLKIFSDGIYKTGENEFLFRTPDERILKELSGTFFGYEDEFFKIKTVSIQIISKKPIKSLISLNPVIVTYTPKDSKPLQWTFESEAGLEYLLKTLHNNLIKKYEIFYNEKLPDTDNFIEMIQIKNQKPLSLVYHKNQKEFKLLGNKFYIVPKENEISQKLAFLALSAGLGEKNALGGGFCKGYFR